MLLHFLIQTFLANIHTLQNLVILLVNICISMYTSDLLVNLQS